MFFLIPGTIDDIMNPNLSLSMLNILQQKYSIIKVILIIIKMKTPLFELVVYNQNDKELRRF